jgi:hypothetical protein
MGLSKDLPSIVQAAESVSRASAASCFHSALFTLRDGKAIPIRAPSSWFLTTSTVSSSSTLRPFSGRCRSWGSSRFFPPRSGIPRNAPTALRSFSSADSYVNLETNLRTPVGPRHLRDRLRPFSSPRTFPPRPFSSTEGSRDLEAFLRLRVRCSRGRCQPRVPGAPMGLSDPSEPVANHVSELSALRQRPLREVGSSVRTFRIRGSYPLWRCFPDTFSYAAAW